MSLRPGRHVLAWLSLWFAAACGVAVTCAPAAARARATESARWSDGYTLVVLDAGADPRRAAQFVRAHGGTVALELPPRCLAGWIAPSLDAALVGRAGIRSIHRDAASLPADLAAHRATFRVARFFARASRGELEIDSAAEKADVVAGPGVLLPDAITAPPVSELDVALNLQALGIASPKKAGASIAANSEAMTGTIAVGLVFVESDGTGSDADTHDWTASREDDVYDDAAAALSWWSSRADDHGDCWATFRLEPFFATEDARCRQWREPVLHASTDFANAVSAVLGNLGYASGNHLARATAFDAALRVQLDTDWAFSAFVAANPSGVTQFTDGYAAWAYLGGPYAALLERSFAWSFKQVFAHETAHAFRACDEYSVAGYGGCSSCTGCVDAAFPNGNCEACNSNPESCMMRANTFALCDYTVAQLGWGQRPCMPQMLPPPLVTALSPDTVVPAQELDLDLQGDLFTSGSSLDCGSGIAVVSLTVLSPSLIRARVRVAVEAAPGLRDVAVVAPDGQVGALAGAFVVRATPRHYVASTGGNRFPYEQPADAAPDLATVLAVASTGDTVYVASGTWAPFALHKTIVLSGSWNAQFATRWPEYPSVIEGAPTAPAVTIDGAANASVLDGFVLRGGGGVSVSPPGIGPTVAGGGVFAYMASPTLRGCTLESNTAGIEGAFGSGGGGLFWGGAPVLERCVVRGNTADRGAGLAFVDCAARLDDVVVDANVGRTSGAGSGIALVAARLVMQGGRVSGNSRSRDGGGLHAVDCPQIELEGVVFEDNAASADGGGLFASASSVACRGGRFVGNTAGDTGGGLQVMGGVLHLDAVLLGANTSAGGGAGAHVDGATGSVVNVTAADNVVGSGVAWFAAPSAVGVRSSIFARNGLGGFMGGGGVTPVFDCVLAWQNQGADWIGVDPGTHARVADPRFVDSASRDYRLGLGSPALDTGDPDPARGDADTSRNDCGAYGGPHATPPAPSRVASIVARALHGHTRLQWTPSPSPGIANYAVYRDVDASAGVGGLEPVALLSAATFEWFDEDGVAGITYAIAAADADGHASAATSATAIEQPTDSEIPAAVLALHPVSPNPVNPGAWIAFDLPQARPVSLIVYAADGRRVRTLAARALPPGAHRVYWDGHTDAGTPTASGVYWVQLDTRDARRTRRIVVIR